MKEFSDMSDQELFFFYKKLHRLVHQQNIFNPNDLFYLEDAQAELEERGYETEEDRLYIKHLCED